MQKMPSKCEGCNQIETDGKGNEFCKDHLGERRCWGSLKITPINIPEQMENDA